MGSGCNTAGCGTGAKCFERIADGCVKYTGDPIEQLGICTNDTLSEVEAVILQTLLTILDGSGITIEDADFTKCDFFQQYIACCSADKSLPNIINIIFDAICQLYTDIVAIQNVINQIINLTFSSKCLNLTNANLKVTIEAILIEICTLMADISTLQAAFTNLTNTLTTTIGTQIGNSIKSCQTGVISVTGTGASTVVNFKGFTPIGGIMMYYGNMAYFDTTGLGLTNTPMCGWALCVTGDTEVLLEDGTTIPISMIVDNKLNVNVMSFDELSGKIVPSKVIDWFKNDVEDKKIWYRIHINHGFSGRKILTLTHNHPVLVEDKGWVSAENLVDGDKMYFNTKGLTETGKQALIGMFLSDGTIHKNKFTLAQSTKNKPFSEFVASKYGVNIGESVQTSGFGKGYSYNRVSFSLKKWCPDFILNVDKKDKINSYILNNLTPVSLAFMYMGDGSLNYDKRTSTHSERMLIHTQGFKKPLIDLLVNRLNLLGYECKAYKRGNQTEQTEDLYESSRLTSEIGWFLYFSKKGTDALAKDIAPYMHPHYKYKLPEKYRNVEFILNKEAFIQDMFIPYNVECKNIYDYNESTLGAEFSKLKYKYRYDIKVENTHSFIANGYIVHNCNGNNGTIDMRGFVPVGSINQMGGGALNTIVDPANNGGQGNYSPGDVGGEMFHFLSSLESGIPIHGHGVTDNQHAHFMHFGITNLSGAATAGGGTSGADFMVTRNRNVSSSDQATGGYNYPGPVYIGTTINLASSNVSVNNASPQAAEKSHENRMPYRALIFIQRIA